MRTLPNAYPNIWKRAHPKKRLFCHHESILGVTYPRTILNVYQTHTGKGKSADLKGEGEGGKVGRGRGKLEREEGKGPKGEGGHLFPKSCNIQRLEQSQL